MARHAGSSCSPREKLLLLAEKRAALIDLPAPVKDP
jgi:hypothetical protein